MIFIVNLMIFTIFNVFTDIYCLQYLQILNDICDWLWENPPLTHKDDYLEKRN